MKNQKLETAIAAVAQKQNECRKTLLRHFAFLCLAILIFALPTLPFVRDLVVWTAAKFLDEIGFFYHVFCLGFGCNLLDDNTHKIFNKTKIKNPIRLSNVL